MKPATTLKELLKPPFFYDEENCVIRDGGDAQITTSRFLSSRFLVANDVKRFLVQALNNEYEREYGEPLRWEYDGYYFICPVCDGGPHKEAYNHCPSCGKRLLPPEKGE
jgi:rubrerythrin